MTRKTTTITLENAGCTGGTAHTVEKVLGAVPGVMRTYCNPATETAYVEYDADRCTTADLERAVESLGVRTIHTAPVPHPARHAVATEKILMHNTGTRSRTWWAFGGFIVIAAFFLMTEHRAHLFGMLPFLLLLACPFLHLFGHGRHGGHGGDGSHGGHGGHGGDARDDATRDDRRSLP
jgi:cation transport ATPase